MKNQFLEADKNFNNIATVGTVYSTDNYRLFKKMNGNRDVQTNEKLREKIKKNGQLSPIVVNEKFEIADGQHRFNILKDLGMPILFVMRENVEVEEVVSMNIAQRNWTLMDYINSYADRGYTEYIKLREFIYSHKNIQPTLLLVAGNGKAKGTFQRIKEKFHEGKYKFDNEAEVRKFIAFYEKLLDETLIDDKYRIQSMLWSVFRQENFDAQRMINKINQLDVAKTINLVNSEPEILKILVTTYNDRLSEKSPKYIKYQFDKKGSLILK